MSPRHKLRTHRKIRLSLLRVDAIWSVRFRNHDAKREEGKGEGETSVRSYKRFLNVYDISGLSV
jgi:hypothetical protein